MYVNTHSFLQVENSMPHPRLAICPHTHMDVIKSAELLRYYVQEDTRNNQLGAGKNVLESTVGVMRSLVKIYNGLDSVPDIATKNDSIKLAHWKQVMEDLMSENVLLRLSHFRTRDYFAQRYYDRRQPLMWFCEKESVACVNPTIQQFNLIYTFQKCLFFDMFFDGEMDEATTQGIKNGITVVLMAENTLFDVALNSSIQQPVPGMKNIMSINAGMKGLRFIVNEFGAFVHTPSNYGIDVPPGMAATIGITAKKTHHLAAPYTNCSVGNPEINLLIETIRQSLGNNTPSAGDGEVTLELSYSLNRCR